MRIGIASSVKCLTSVKSCFKCLTLKQRLLSKSIQSRENASSDHPLVQVPVPDFSGDFSRVEVVVQPVQEWPH